jgi:general secretion pathway protein H
MVSGDGRTAVRRRRHAAGFTLIELAIVLFVVGIAASFVVPRLRSSERVVLDTAASRLATSIRWVYEEAALRQLPLRLNLDLDQQEYWVSAYNEDPDAPAFEIDRTPLARPQPLPDDVVIADVVTSTDGTVDGGLVLAQFLPEGATDVLVIHLQSRGGAFSTIAFDPLTGRTRVGDGYLAVPEAALERPAGATDAADTRFRGSSTTRERQAPMQRSRYRGERGQ